MLVVFAVRAVRIVRVESEFGTTLSMCCVCVGSAVAVGVAIVVFSVTWVFVADGELTGTGGSAAFDDVYLFGWGRGRGCRGRMSKGLG